MVTICESFVGPFVVVMWAWLSSGPVTVPVTLPTRTSSNVLASGHGLVALPSVTVTVWPVAGDPDTLVAIGRLVVGFTRLTNSTPTGS